MNNYDLEQLYIHKIAGTKIISEANNPFGTSPYGVGSRIKRALTPFMSKTAQRSEAKSQQDINDMYNKFVAALAKVGKREGDAKYGDLTAYLAKLINASAATSKTWDQLNVNPTQTFNTFGALSLGNAFKRIVEEVNQSSLTAAAAPAAAAAAAAPAAAPAAAAAAPAAAAAAPATPATKRTVTRLKKSYIINATEVAFENAIRVLLSRKNATSGLTDNDLTNEFLRYIRGTKTKFRK